MTPNPDNPHDFTAHPRLLAPEPDGCDVCRDAQWNSIHVSWQCQHKDAEGKPAPIIGLGKAVRYGGGRPVRCPRLGPGEGGPRAGVITYP